MKKETFLQNVRTQLNKAVLPGAEPERPASLQLEEKPLDELIEQFTAEVTAVAGHVHDVEDSEAAWQTLVSLFEQYEVTDFLAWDDAHLPVEHTLDELEASGYKRGQTELPHDLESRTAAQQALGAAQVGITSVDGGISETGTIVVRSGSGRGRHVSLLPTVHVALVRKSQLVPTMAHFIRQNASANHEASNVVFITGPSRTADIEQTLTLGVHGPKELHVILW